MNNKEKGKLGEDLAAEFLKEKNYEILERNWRYGQFGEIDIIAKDNNELVFVEVKTRSTANFGLPVEAINEKKLFQIKNIANAYIMQSAKKYKKHRIDAICILLNPQEIKHLKGIS